MSSTNGNGAATRSPAALLSSPPAKEISETLEFIEELTTNVDAVQERVLTEILSRNADSEYLAMRCGLAGATDRATFRAKVPMVTYKDVKPYILRIANGDKSPILSGSGNPISEFFFSSGTSGGECKLIPVVKDELDRDSPPLRSLAMAALSRDVSGLDKGSALYFFFVRSDTTTPGGLPARSAVSSALKLRFSNKEKEVPYDPRRSCTSPPAAILCEDVSQSMYVHMLCGLCHRLAVVRVGALFGFVVVRAMSFLQLNWLELAADIEAGALLTQRVTDPSVREAVAGVLRRPDPELARFVRTECGKGDWGGIITRIWPNTKCLETVVTGSMAQYVPTLNYYSGGLPIASIRYASAECRFGINLRPMCDPCDVSYTILPNMAYFEFLPVDAATATSDQLVELAGVEAGREYELVVTTLAGLSRYRVGDILCVTGFHNAAPQFRFVGRKNVVLSVVDDKTEEAELQQAVERASKLLHPHGAAVLDYTSRTCTESIPGHYVVYWELRLVDDIHQSSVDGDVLARCCLEMEEALNYLYRRFRVADGLIGPLEIRVVQSGTFEELADYAVSHGGASSAQYKVPRCVTFPAIVHLLDSRVVSSHSSPALPHWAPGYTFD